MADKSKKTMPSFLLSTRYSLGSCNDPPDGTVKRSLAVWLQLQLASRNKQTPSLRAASPRGNLDRNGL
ncbi:MAG: hypothetical protein KAJ07_09975 [Planctomycetes bacterium]|nr:hypothetical protein [Planctomycetota bacterium]